MNSRIDLRWVVSLLLLLAFPLLIRSQTITDVVRPDADGRHSIAGIVYSPTGKPAGRGITVRLSKGAQDIIAWTDEDGEFRITGMGNGTYTLTVSPDGEYESESQRVEITLPRGSPPQTFHVNLQLRFKPDARPKTGVIDAELASVPKKVLQQYVKAKSAAAAGNLQNAVDEFLKAIAMHPDFAAAHYELGVLYQKLDQLERSDEHLQISIKLRPGAYDPLANRGLVLVRMKKFADGESVLRDALKIKDDSPVIRFYLGRALVGQSRPNEAEAEFRAALKMGGNEMNEARRALTNIYLDRGENEKALSEIEAYLAINPTPADEKRLRDTLQQLRDRVKENSKP
jgi:tetratricopeptide (TPR) repeat protein